MTDTAASSSQNPTSTASDFHSIPQFPYHTSPRTWLIVSGVCNTGFRLAKLLLNHGDNVVLGTTPSAYDDLQAAVAAETAGKTGGNSSSSSSSAAAANPLAGSTASPFSPGLDQAYGRYESEQLRRFLLELDEPADTPSSPSPPSSSSASSSLPPQGRLRLARLDPRAPAQCQSAVAIGVAAFGSVDVLVCNSSMVVIGTVEELGVSEETLGLVREQFEVNFYSSVNAIKASIPAMRDSGKGGHLVVITGISGHLGTPGLGAYCAAGWALEGYCDSIAYEVAPFNIKVSIVQPHLETAVLPNQIKAPPSLPQYTPPSHPAPLARSVIGGLLDRIQSGTSGQSAAQSQSQSQQSEGRRDSAATDQTSGSDDATRPVSRTLGSSTGVSIHEPRLPRELLDGLIRETLFSICAIGGHPNPPQRHIVGTEGVVSVKEKLKTVSVELEDLVQASTAVDIIMDESVMQQQ